MVSIRGDIQKPWVEYLYNPGLLQVTLRAPSQSSLLAPKPISTSDMPSVGASPVVHGLLGAAEGASWSLGHSPQWDPAEGCSYTAWHHPCGGGCGRAGRLGLLSLFGAC